MASLAVAQAAPQPKPSQRWKVWKQNNPEATPAAPPQPRIYIVRKGDTLTHIARAHGVSLRRLAAENGLNADRSIIRPGQKLRIPQR